MGYSYQNVASWTNSIDFFNTNSFFFPINRHNSHWTLVHIDMVGRTISYYDSMNGQSDAENYCPMFRRWLCDAADKRDAPLNLVALGWRDTCAVCPKQTNSYDCGVYVIKGIEQLSKGLTLKHYEQDIANFRAVNSSTFP